MEASWTVEVSREWLLERLTELSRSGSIEDYLGERRLFDYGMLSIRRGEVPVFSADVFLAEGLEELALLDFHLLDIEPPFEIGELSTRRVEDRAYYRALARESFELFLEGHPVVHLGSYDPWISLHVARDGDTLKVLSLEWYGPHQEVYFEVPLDEWLESTVKLYAMVLRDLEKMRGTFIRYGWRPALEELGRLRALLRALLDAYPIDVDSLPPAYAPWEVEDVIRSTSRFLANGDPNAAKCLLDSLKTPNHYRWALFRIHEEPETLETLYHILEEPYRSEALSHLAYLYVINGNPERGIEVAEEVGGDTAYENLALGFIRVGDFERALEFGRRIENRWLRSKVLLWAYLHRRELKGEVLQSAPEHVRVFIEEREKGEGL